MKMIKTYNVIWEIDIDARSPVEAAKKALKIQRDTGSTATIFEVSEHGGENLRPSISKR